MHYVLNFAHLSIFLFYAPTALAPFGPPTRYTAPHPTEPLHQCDQLVCLATCSGDFTFGAATLAGSRLDLPSVNMVELRNVTVSYRLHPALHHINGHFAHGSLTAVVGPNGAGKSTLLKSILGLLPLSGGSIKVTTPRQQIAYLPQVAEIDRQFPLSVQDCVALGFWNATGAFQSIGSTHLLRIAAALQAVGLSGFEQRTIGTLSSGQLQRVLFARLLVQNADLILLDEPFNAVDSRTTTELLRLVQHWHQQGTTIIAVVHDDAQIQAFFPQTLLLARQTVAWGPTAQTLIPEHLTKARLMSEAWDESAEICHVDLDAANEATQ